MPDKILNEDWSDYDNKKIIGKADRNKFSCTENWEVNYLIDKIHSAHPNYTKQKIQTAIRMACMASKSPHPREMFVSRIMEFLCNL